MPLFGLIVVAAIGFLVSTGISMALSYLNKPKTKKSNPFDSNTYHLDGMPNSINPGTPKNIIYGEHKVAPQIINNFTDANGDTSTVKVLMSLGEETTGIWNVKVNDSHISRYYKAKDDYDIYWCPGRSSQLVYKGVSPRTGTLRTAVTPGYNKTIDFDLDKIDDKAVKTFETPIGAAQPEYALIYLQGDKDSFEVIPYTNLNTIGSGPTRYIRLLGCTVIKSHAIGDKIKQEFILDHSGATPKSIIRGFNFTTLATQDIGDGGKVISGGGGSFTQATNNKIDKFAVTIGFESGLYNWDKEEGPKPAQVTFRIAYKKTSSGTWPTEGTPVETILSATSTDSDEASTAKYINITKNSKKVWMVNSDGTDYTGFKDAITAHLNFDDIKYTGDGSLKKDYWLEFTSKDENNVDVNNRLAIKKFEAVIADEQLYYNDVTGTYENKYKYKVVLKEKYRGNSYSSKAYEITYEKVNVTNPFEVTTSLVNKQSSYRLTYTLPEDSTLDYDFYDIRVTKVTADTPTGSNAQNEMTWLTLQEISKDKMEYPLESLLALIMPMNEKLNTSVQNITCMAQGKSLVDVQNASTVWAASVAKSIGNFVRPTTHNGRYYRCKTAGTTGGSEPTWPEWGTVTDGTVTWEIANRFSSNPADICADIILSKRYGRGEYLELTNDKITSFYNKYSTEAAFCDETITENGKPRPRFRLDLNVDFRGPLIDLLQSVGQCFRGKFYFDGEVPMLYIDRTKAPSAVFCMANIVEDTYTPQTLDLTDDINRITAQFLNKSKNYTHDTCTRDIVGVNSSWSIKRLQDKDITLYGLIKKWYVEKILYYLLRFAYLIKNTTNFDTTLDGISVDIGDTFYCHDDTMNLNAQSGRILAVTSNSITLHKAFTFAGPGNTYKAILRKDNGTPHTELTVDLTATGTGAQTVVYFTTSISSVSVNSIYILGISTGYYQLFRCVTKTFKMNKISIGAIQYDPEVYRIYYNDGTDAAATTQTPEDDVEQESTVTESIPGQELPALTVVESMKDFGTVYIHLRKPVPSNSWGYANIYIQPDDEEEWQFIGRTRGEPLKATGLRLGQEYTARAVSYSIDHVPNTNYTETDFEIFGDSDKFTPPEVTGIRVIGKGSTTNVYGSSFEIAWNFDSKLSGDDKTSNYISHAGLSNVYENMRYKAAVYYSAIPDSVKNGSVKVNTKEAYYEIVQEPRFSFSVEENIEAISDLWTNYSTHASYDTYYGNPQRTVTIGVTAINGYGKTSKEVKITLTNPAPDMNDSAGANTTPTLTAIKSGIRVKFRHPYQEYDISHFLIEYAENSAFTTNLQKLRIPSSININSSDEDVSLTQYKVEIDNLDPKKTYWVRVRPADVYGTGTASNSASKVPGLTNDDSETDIAVPGQVTGVTFEVISNGKLKGSWNLLSDTDITKYHIDWRSVQDTAASDPPTLLEVEQGYLDADNTKKCYGQKETIIVKDSADEPGVAKNWIIIQTPKTGYKYFLKVRAENSSEQKGAWSTWATHSDAVTGITSDDFAFEYRRFIFTGTFTSANQTRVNWSSGTLKFKKADGTFLSYSISSGGSVNNVSVESWIIWKESASTVFTIVTDPYVAGQSGAVIMAHCLPGATASDYAVYFRYSDKSDYVINASQVTAGAIDTASLRALGVKASKMDIDGTLTMLHGSNAKFLFKDSGGTNRIKIAVVNGGDPLLNISKSTYDVDSDTDPDHLLFSSTYNYFKIIQSGWTQLSSVTFAAKTVNANSMDVTQVQSIATSAVGEKKVLICNFRSSVFSGPTFIEFDACDANGLAFRWWDATHVSDGAGGWEIRVTRALINNSGVNVNFGAIDSTYYLYWALITESQD